ncbi:nephrin-like protein, partial [Dinothrombium tinctorium]
KPKGVTIEAPRAALKEGKKIDALCTTWGSKPFAKISWTLDNKEITRTRVIHSRSGNWTQSAFTLSPSGSDDQKLLVCTAENHKLKNATITDVHRLNIHYKPVLSLALVENQQFAVDGKSVILNCSVASNPLVHYIQWFFNRKALTNDSNQGFHFENTTLLIRKVNVEKHIGYYQCSARNAEGIGFSNVFHLDVYYAPVCKTDPISFYVKLGNAVRLKCSVDAFPKTNIRFEWRLVRTFSTVNIKSGKSLNNYTTNGLESELLFVPRNADDIGVIYCLASNVAGKQKAPCQFVLAVPTDPPSAPSECRILNKSKYSFDVWCETTDSLHNSSNLAIDFHLELYESKNQNLLLKLTENVPKFTIIFAEFENSTNAGKEEVVNYVLKVYANNTYGKSSFVQLTVEVNEQLMFNRTSNYSMSSDFTQIDENSVFDLNKMKSNPPDVIELNAKLLDLSLEVLYLKQLAI